jgi:hypothetical protein
MSFEARCPQCVFVSRQLGQPTPCLLHVSQVSETETGAATPSSTVAADADYDEPYVFGALRISVDRPGPFSLREYVRLQLLRTRLQAEASALDTRTDGTPATTLAGR